MSTDIQIGNITNNFAALQHDILLDAVGRPITLSGIAKLEQDILKILVTSINYFYPAYGTQIEEMVGISANLITIKSNLQTEVVNALNYLQYLQTSQAKYQIVDAAEMIGNIQSVQVDYLYDVTLKPSDLTSFAITIVVENNSGQIISVNRTLSLN